MIEGICEPSRFLALVQDFIVFEDDGGELAKKMAGYHQFHAVRVAVDEDRCELRSCSGADGQVAGTGRKDNAAHRSGGQPGDRRIGVVLAHPGVGQEPDHGLLRGRHRTQPCNGEPHHCRTNRPQRPRRPAIREPSPAAMTSCASPRRRRPAAPICATSFRSSPVAWCSPPSRSSFPRRGVTPTRPSPSAGTSWSSQMRRIAASTISSTALPVHMRDALPNASFVGFTGHSHRAPGR